MVVGNAIVVASALLGAVVAQTAAPAAVIWHGRKAGDATVDLQRPLEDARRVLDALGAVYDVPASVPRIVKSDDVAGLNPGFEVVLVATCPAGLPSGFLEALQALRPGVYQKDLTPAAATAAPGDAGASAAPVAVPAQCPEPTVETNGQPVVKVAAAKTLRVGPERTLRVVTLQSEEQSLGDFAIEVDQAVLAATLVDKRGNVEAVEVLKSPSAFAQHEGLRAEGKRLVATVRYADPPCHASTGTTSDVEIIRKRHAVEVEGDEIRIKEISSKVVSREKCDGFAAERAIYER